MVLPIAENSLNNSCHCSGVAPNFNPIAFSSILIVFIAGNHFPPKSFILNMGLPDAYLSLPMGI